MDKAELEQRMKTFALRVIRFVAASPRNKVTDVLGYQLLKSGTSIGANYREANRAVSETLARHLEREQDKSEIPNPKGSFHWNY